MTSFTGKFARSTEAYHVTTKQPDHDARTRNDGAEESGEDKPRSPLAHGAMLLCLYILMYLAVAALLHNMTTLSTALTTVESSLANAERVLTAVSGESLTDTAGRRSARSKTWMIDANCD